MNHMDLTAIGAGAMGVVIVRAHCSSFVDKFCHFVIFQGERKFYSNKIDARECYFIECIYNFGPKSCLVLGLCGSQISL